MNSTVVLGTLFDSDPEFRMLVECLYGPGAPADEVHADVFGEADSDRPLTHLEERYDLVSKWSPSQSALVQGALRGARRAKIRAGIREPLPKVPGANPTQSKVGPVPLGEASTTAERGQRAGATLRHPLKVARAYPKTAVGGALAAGAVLEHRRNSGTVALDPETGLYKADDGDRRKRAITAGLSAVGAGAGAYGLGLGVHEARLKGREIAPAAPRLKQFRTGVKALPRRTKALIPLEAAGLGGELMATHILHGDTKKKTLKQPVAKATGDFVAEGTFSKFDEDKRLAFGWASVVQKDGLPVIDRQGDYISAEDLEEAAYRYVLNSRIGGDMHKRAGEAPHHVSDLVESFVITPEKIAKMGLPPSTPVGWWVGFKVHDEDTWQMVKKGGRTGFSIHGRGKREHTDMDTLVAS